MEQIPSHFHMEMAFDFYDIAYSLSVCGVQYRPTLHETSKNVFTL